MLLFRTKTFPSSLCIHLHTLYLDILRISSFKWSMNMQSSLLMSTFLERFFVGVPRINHPGKNHITVETQDVNREGYWTLVLHTVFFYTVKCQAHLLTSLHSQTLLHLQATITLSNSSQYQIHMYIWPSILRRQAGGVHYQIVGTKLLCLLWG